MTGVSILQIVHDHPDWTPGGTEIVAHGLARALGAQGGVRSTYLGASTSLQRPGGVAGELGAQGGDLVIHTGAYDRFTMTRLDGTAWVESMGRVLSRVRPDVIHLHGLDRIGAEIVPLLRRLVPRTRIVLTLHDYQIICPNDGLLLTVPDGARCGGSSPDRCRRCFPDQGAARHALRRTHLMALLHEVDAFIAPSRFLRDRFVAWGLDRARISILPNAVEAQAATAEPSRARRDRFAFFGNVAPHKGILTLLDAAALLKERRVRVGLALHGGLSHPEPAFAQAFEAGLAAARPLAQHFGPYERDEVGALMRQADWIVVPSVWWENAPLVVLEAQAAGRPVICSGVGGMAELVEDGVTGLHVPPGDSRSLAETMRVAAADPELWAHLAPTSSDGGHNNFVQAHMDLYLGLMRVAA